MRQTGSCQVRLPKKNKQKQIEKQPRYEVSINFKTIPVS